MIIGKLKFNTKAVLIATAASIGGVIDIVTPLVTQYQAFIPPKYTPLVLAGFGSAAVVWHKFQPLVEQAEKQEGDGDDNTGS